MKELFISATALAAALLFLGGVMGGLGSDHRPLFLPRAILARRVLAPTPVRPPFRIAGDISRGAISGRREEALRSEAAPSDSDQASSRETAGVVTPKKVAGAVGQAGGLPRRPAGASPSATWPAVSARLVTARSKRIDLEPNAAVRRPPAAAPVAQRTRLDSGAALTRPDAVPAAGPNQASGGTAAQPAPAPTVQVVKRRVQQQAVTDFPIDRDGRDDRDNRGGEEDRRGPDSGPG